MLMPTSASRKQQVRFFTVRPPCRSEKLATHSKQRAFNRDVINPQEGHILWDRNPAICGFLRIQWSGKSVNTTTSRPKEIVIAFIKATLRGEFRADRVGMFQCSRVGFLGTLAAAQLR
jgi:hypothetical protein